MCLALMLCISSQGQDLETIGSNDPLRLRGGLQLSSTFYAADSIDRRKPPFGYAISGNLVFSLYGVDMPVSFLFSNYQKDFRQPFNHFGISPRYKWVTVHLGYRRIRFSPFTLNGHRFLGVGVEANPGLLRFGAVYGKFQKAIEEDSTYLENEDVRTLPRPAYARKGYSFKLGVGNERNYFDVTYFKGKDDENSLSFEPSTYSVYPEENAAIGISTKLTIKKALSWYVELGASAYTRDHTQPEIVDEEDSGFYKFLENLLVPRVSSQASIGIESGLEYRRDLWGTKFLYKRIDPGYKTMGAYYFQTDLTQYILSLNLRTKNQKFRMNGSIGLQSDNVRNNKIAKTNRTIGALVFNIYPSQKFGIDIQYSNFGIAQKSGLKSISDTTRLRNINQTLNISPRVTLPGRVFNHGVGLTFSYTDLNDKNDFTKDLTEVKSLSTFLFYNINHLATGIAVNFGLNRITSTVPAGETVASGYTVGIGKAFFDGKIRTTANYMRNSNKYESEKNGFTARARVSVSYIPARAHRLQLSFSHLKNDSKNVSVSRSFTENTTKISYSYRFDTMKKQRK